MLKITIEGTPLAKGRPRFARRGKFISTYTPTKTRDHEAVVAEVGRIAMGMKQLITGAVSVLIRFYMPIPASSSKAAKKRMVDGLELHTKKPDIDNLEKQYLDALNGIVWNDDSQIIALTAYKMYSENPRTEIEICEV